MAASVFKAGNTALITGGASGIGLAMAKKCYGYGMNVAIVDNNKEGLSAAEKSIGEKVATYPMDVAKIEEWKDLKGKIERKFGEFVLYSSNEESLGTGNWEEDQPLKSPMDSIDSYA